MSTPDGAPLSGAGPGPDFPSPGSGLPGYPPPGTGYLPPAGPTAYSPGGPPGQVLVTVGDISCTQTEVLVPNGRASLRGTTWTVQNQTAVTTKIPTWAIVVAVVGLLIICVFSLLFLLVKERTVQGIAQVTVQGPGLLHTTSIPVTSEVQMRDIESRVNYIRGLVTALG
ncbi:MAG TPA: hypothetical protein VME20_06590 [Acidimicrobiales bacterium]|nr:hypothetical protein [Acidimicrobiales bacterium]